MAGDGSCCNMNGLERRYHSLRAHLDELGFRQPLAIECVPLVEALFKDLLHTTSSLENYKKQAQELDEQVRVLNKGVQPFRTDNERLVRQITELNKQITKIKEEAESSVGDAKARCRKLEHENADLQFLVSQHLSRIRTLEVESTEKSKKLLSLQSAPSISIGKKKSGLNSQTKVEILSSIGPSKKQPPGRPWLDVFSGALTQTEDPFVVNMVDRSQAELRAARYEMKLLREEKEKLSETISSLKQQVRDRDLDIAKLHTQVENNRCHPSARDPEIMKDDYTIANLRATIVSLEDSNNNLRTQLQDALRKQHEAMMRAVHLAERNQVLTNEIRNVDNVAMRVEDSCNHTVKETSQRIIDLQEQLSHYQKMVADLERTGVEARCNAQNLSIDLEKLRLENKHLLETQQFRNTQSHLQTDRVEMSRQQHIEKELTKEIENLVAAVTYQKQKISELEEKVALTTAENQAASSAPVSGTGSGSATSKGSSNSSSGRSGVATKKQSTAKKTVTHAPSSKNPSGDNGKARSSNRSAGIQTDMKRIDSKEVQVNLRHEPPERETAQSYSGDRGDRYKETEYRKEKRRDFKSKREEEVEEYTSERYTEEGQERWSQESRKDQERRAKDKSRKQDDHGSERSQPTQKVDRGSQSEEVGPSKSNASQNNNNINHHHHPCMDGAGDGPWNVKSPPDLCPIIKTLEAERNFFEKEYLRIREYLDNLPEKLGSTDLLWKLREAHAELDLLRAENHRLSKEVADLSAVYKCEAADSRSHSDANRALAEKYTKVQQRLGEKERELLLVCEENHSLLTERDSLRLLAQRESHECERLSNDIHSLQLEIDILRAKKSADVEKDRLIEENRSLQLEIGVLRGQKEGEKTLDRERERERERLAEENRRLRETIETLKTSTMFNSSEKMCYDQPQQSVMAVVDALHSTQKRVWELESDGRDASRTFDREVLELRSQLSARTKQLDAATLQSEAARTRLTELQNSLAQANANHMKMKVLLEETERSLEQTQNDLSRLQTDSVHQQERIQKLEYDRAALEKEVNSLRSEVQRLHGSINDLENEKDELIRTADERAEQVQMLSEDIRQRDNRIKQLEKAIHDLQYAAE